MVFEGIKLKFIAKDKLYIKLEVYSSRYTKFGKRIKDIEGINIVSKENKIQPTIVIAERHWIHSDFASYYLKNIPVFWYDHVKYSNVFENILTSYNKKSFKGLYTQHVKFRENYEDPLTLKCGHGFKLIFYRTPIIFYENSDKWWLFKKWNIKDCLSKFGAIFYDSLDQLEKCVKRYTDSDKTIIVYSVENTGYSVVADNV